MIKATIIFGEDAVCRYDETCEIPSDKWLEQNGGVVDEKTFKTIEEFNAYCEEINDADGWSGSEILDPEITEESTQDCQYCEQWRSFFADRESQTYCPDCGLLIVNTKTNQQ